MGKRKRRPKTEKLGTITVLDQIKMAQDWQGNQRGQVHKNKKAYNRKRKHKGKDYDRANKKLLVVS